MGNVAEVVAEKTGKAAVKNAGKNAGKKAGKKAGTKAGTKAVKQKECGDGGGGRAAVSSLGFIATTSQDLVFDSPVSQGSEMACRHDEPSSFSSYYA